METVIGKHEVVVISMNWSNMPLCSSNAIAVIMFDGETYDVFRQGGIEIWAFPKRIFLTRSEEDEFDSFMDKAWANRKVSVMGRNSR